MLENHPFAEAVPVTPSIRILDKLIAYPTVSRTPNIELINFVQETLTEAGATCQLIPSDDGRNANLYAHIGPADRPGIMLSGHSDVVPVKGQDWSKNPFELTEHEGNYFGRGTADMKGFVACAIHAMQKAAQVELKIPLQFALSYDEEIGCVGVRRMLDMLESAPVKPSFCIVGEPTELKVAIGHKGKTALRATCTGKEAHSALAPTGLNAIHLASDLIGVLRDEQTRLEREGARDNDYDIPYSTIHVGVISGGVALNIVPKQCVIDFEIRNIAQDDPTDILHAIQNKVESLISNAKRLHPQADIQIEIVNEYPMLDTPVDTEIVSFVKSLTDETSTFKVAFGTEGGLFKERLGVPAVVCGPGSMDQGHKPDEFVSGEQLAKCDAMMDRLIEYLKG